MNAETSQTYCERCLTTFGQNPERCPNLVCKRFRPDDGWGKLYQAGQVIDRNYRVLQMLAMGGAGVTYRARELSDSDEMTGPDLALKVLFQSRSGGSYLRRLATEAQIIQELDHQNIVQYHGFVHRSGHAPYLITGYESGGSLLAHLERTGALTVQQTVAIGRQICAALEKAHEYGVVHRDLKPENVLLREVVGKDEDPEVRVADFGIAKVQAGLGSNVTRAGAFVGTPHYAAPEQFQGLHIGDGVDVYGCGAMLYFCMTLRYIVKFADRLDPLDSYDLLRENLPPVVDRPEDDPLDVARMNRILAVAMHPDPEFRCDIKQFGEMLQAVLDRKEPVIPAPQARTPASFTTDLRDDGPRRVPTSPPSAAFTLENQPVPPDDKAVLGLGIAALMGGLLLLVLVVVGGAGFLLWKTSDSLESGDSDTDPVGVEDTDIPTLSGDSTDPGEKADYTAILRSSRMVSARLKRQCKVTMPEQVGLELVLEANGSVRSAQVVKPSSPSTTACVVGQVGGHRFKRAGDGPVRIRLDVTIR